MEMEAPVNVAIKKVTERESKERFVLINSATREVITVHDVSEATLRKFFRQRGMPEELVDRCFDRARDRYAANQPAARVDDASETMQDDDLLFELGLSDDKAS